MSAVTGDELRQRHTAQPAGMKTPPSDLQTPPTSEDESSLKQAGGKRPATAAGKGGKRSSDGIPGSDDVLPDDYVMRTLAREQALPPIKWRNVLSELQWVSTIVLTTTPLLAIYGMFTTSLTLKTAIWSIIYYFISGLGITAGYHRLWAHRAYSATPVLQYALACMGTSAVEGSIHWWARGHRAHHRYTDTDLDPYGAHHGLLWSHLGWMIVKPRRKPGVADISDLRRNPVIKFQHKFYIPLILFFGFILPTIVAGFGWGDWRGGFFYAAICRLVFVHHSTFCVNSLAHWLGEASFDNKHTPRDHFLTALVTVGEGYHNFHHQFPMDYRNATIWYQYDPTKWFISAMKMVGLAYDLKQFPDNEVKMGRLTMDLQKAHDKAQALKWPKKISELPVVSWDEFAEESKTRDLIVVQGIVHDVSSFITEHPGGIHLLKARVGKDASTAFNGGVYEHSRAAHNLLATMRVGVLDGGYQLAYQTLQKIKAEKEVAAVDADSSSDAGSGTGSDSKTQTQTPALTRSTSEDSASSAEASGARTPNDNAINYVIPGEAYTVIKRVDLTANEVAARHGNKVGKLSWK